MRRYWNVKINVVCWIIAKNKTCDFTVCVACEYSASHRFSHVIAGANMERRLYSQANVCEIWNCLSFKLTVNFGGKPLKIQSHHFPSSLRTQNVREWPHDDSLSKILWQGVWWDPLWSFVNLYSRTTRYRQFSTSLWDDVANRQVNKNDEKQVK